MKRLIPWLAASAAAAMLAAPAVSRAQSREGTQRSAPTRESSRNARQDPAPSSGSKSEARLQYYASEAALLTALAHAAAMVDLTDVPEADMDMARTYVHTINREAQACEGTSVKVGQAVHSAERQQSMKDLRNELKEVMKSIDDAQTAVDGHGPLGPHAKNAYAHLEKALIALIQLGADIGVKPLPAPGSDILRHARSVERERANPVR